MDLSVHVPKAEHFDWSSYINNDIKVDFLLAITYLLAEINEFLKALRKGPDKPATTKPSNTPIDFNNVSILYFAFVLERIIVWYIIIIKLTNIYLFFIPFQQKRKFYKPGLALVTEDVKGTRK